ncbi:hypothetical protein JCM10213_005823 [Rhodosporidiobolus nylandii]
MPCLEVRIGPDRFHTEIAWVNHSSRPTEIDTPLFAGRVLVLVKDFAGVTPDNSPPKKDSKYFEGRSRKFAILIEGRFKARDGVKPYTAEEVQFGSDFDYLPESFPQGPFNAGMRIAKWVDPATYYETKTPNGRPFIMSPYAACMNTFCAYPSPIALSRAVVLSHHDAQHPHHDDEELDAGESFVPMEEVDHDRHKWHERAYWRFVGLKGDPRVDAFLSTHSHLFLPSSSTSSTASSSSSSAARPGLAHHPSSLALGTGAARSASPEPLSGSHGSSTPSKATAQDGGQAGFGWGAPIPLDPSSPASSGAATPSQGDKDGKKEKKKSKFSLSSLASALEKSVGAGGGKSEEHDHLLMADQLAAAGGPKGGRGEMERLLGPWRFADEGVDAMEDSTFIFLDPSHPRTVAQRRKHFVQNDGENRKAFVYDPDLIYTASFFTPFCDLNTFDIKMGPVNINIAPYFTKMPVRYTLRSTRLAPPPDGSSGPLEEEVFATISFRLVD